MQITEVLATVVLEAVHEAAQKAAFCLGLAIALAAGAALFLIVATGAMTCAGHEVGREELD